MQQADGSGRSFAAFGLFPGKNGNQRVNFVKTLPKLGIKEEQKCAIKRQKETAAQQRGEKRAWCGPEPCKKKKAQRGRKHRQ